MSLDKKIQNIKSSICGNNESDDDDHGLLHFYAESHLFNYLRIEKV